MNTQYSRSHLSDHALTRDLPAGLARAQQSIAHHLADLAEFDARRLYLAEGYPSMLDYCTGGLGLAREAALKRIRAARVARMFPVLFDAVADGRLCLSGIVLLASRLTPDNIDELLAAVARRSKSEIERFLEWRFSRPLLATQVSPGTLDASAPVLVMAPPPPPQPRVHITLQDETLAKLRYLQTLVSHQDWSRSVTEVIGRSLDVHIRQIEKRRFAATDRPHTERRRVSTSRCIPAAVRRTVWRRDGGRCTFVGPGGHRCESRTRLEYDHVREVARGGTATAENVRLLCRAHNQFSAERAFGAEFMRRKREAAKLRFVGIPAA